MRLLHTHSFLLKLNEEGWIEVFELGEPDTSFHFFSTRGVRLRRRKNLPAFSPRYPRPEPGLLVAKVEFPFELGNRNMLGPIASGQHDREQHAWNRSLHLFHART